MLGAIIGDIVGSRFMGRPVKDKNFALFTPECRFTGVTVLTVAVADSLFHGGSFGRNFITYLGRYPQAGYNESFIAWSKREELRPLASTDNGAAARIAPMGWAHAELSATLEASRRCALVTHDHAESVTGAQAVAAAVFLGRAGKDKSFIKRYLSKHFGCDLTPSLADLRQAQEFDQTCTGSVPGAIVAFLESESLEDAVRGAVSLGGDACAQAAMAGAVAEAFYREIPRNLAGEALKRLDDALAALVHGFHGHCCARQVSFVAPDKVKKHKNEAVAAPEPQSAEPKAEPQAKESPQPAQASEPAPAPQPAEKKSPALPPFAAEIQGPVLVVGDVHGQSRALMALLKNAWKVVPNMSKRWVVFLGDFLDRGPDPKGVMDIVLALRKRHPMTTAVMGNHELTCARALGLLPGPQSQEPAMDLSDSMATTDGQGILRMRTPQRRYLAAYSAHTTFRSFKVEEGDMEGLVRALGPERQQLLTDLPWVVEHKDYIFVHAGLVRNMGVEEQLAVLRSRDFSLNRPPWLHDHALGLSGPPATCERVVVSGHAPQSRVIKGQNRILLDTSRGRKLSALLLPEGRILEQDFA